MYVLFEIFKKIQLHDWYCECNTFLNMCKYIIRDIYVLRIDNKVILLQNHPRTPDVWCIAAKYYYFNKSDPKTAFTMLHKGISFNKCSKVLYKEVVQLEIYQVMGSESEAKIEMSKELEEKQEICLKALNAYMKTIFKNIKDSSFYCDLLTFLVKYKFTVPIQNDIIKKLLETHHQKPQVWDYLAKREYEGYHYQNPNSTSHKLKSSLCFERYKEGLSRIMQSDDKQELWNMCIDFLIKINLDDFGSSNISKAKFLLEAYQQASAEGYLSEEHYISWIDNVRDANEKYSITEKGTNAYPRSIDLWRQRFYLKQDLVFGTQSADQEMKRLFQQGVRALENDSSVLWNGMLRYYLLNEKFDLLEELYKDGVKQPGAVGMDLKARYITHLNLNKGIDAARAAYREIAVIEPYCKELHEAMWRAESTELDFNFAEWENVHKLAVEQFGKEDVDVWIDYLRFYMLYNQNLKKEIVEDIMQKALETLPEHLKWEFQGKYDQLQNLARHDSD